MIKVKDIILFVLAISRMTLDRISGKKIIVFDIQSPGQLQFIMPILDELQRRDIKQSHYLSCDYFAYNKHIKSGFPSPSCIPNDIAKYCFLTDIFLETEIYGRGPKNAIKVFIGHGQPNKLTNWADENLKAFDTYFLYGDLERSMFKLILEEKPEYTKHIELKNIGYPKLDAQLNGEYDREKILKNLGLNPDLKTVIYAPAWDPGGSLRTYGVVVAEKLLEIENLNVIVKLHPVSLESDCSEHYEFYTGGINWEESFGKLESRPNFKYAKEQLVNPLLVASDIMVTDFSGVALEFMVLDRPVIYIDSPEFYDKTLKEWGCDPDLAKNDERFNAGRNAGIVVETLDELPVAIKRAISHPMELHQKRKNLIDRFLYNPGEGAKSTVDAVEKML